MNPANEGAAINAMREMIREARTAEAEVNRIKARLAAAENALVLLVGMKMEEGQYEPKEAHKVLDNFAHPELFKKMVRPDRKEAALAAVRRHLDQTKEQ